MIVGIGLQESRLALALALSTLCLFAAVVAAGAGAVAPARSRAPIPMEHLRTIAVPFAPDAPAPVVRAASATRQVAGAQRPRIRPSSRPAPAPPALSAHPPVAGPPPPSRVDGRPTQPGVEADPDPVRPEPQPQQEQPEPSSIRGGAEETRSDPEASDAQAGTGGSRPAKPRGARSPAKRDDG